MTTCLGLSPPAPTEPQPHELVDILRRIQSQSCPHTYNFHLHTTYSDGQLSPETVVNQALEYGLSDFAITDHHALSGYDQAQAYLGLLSPQDYPHKPRLWPGIEITALLLDVDVHILGYGFDPRHPGLTPYMQGTAPVGASALATHVIAALHQAGGLAVLAHPARYKRSPAELIPAIARLGIDGVETYYSYGNSRPWSPSLEPMNQVGTLAQHYNLLETCGTDTHGTTILQRL